MTHRENTAAGAFEARSSEVRFLMARLGFALADKRDLAAADPTIGATRATWHTSPACSGRRSPSSTARRAEP